MPRLLPLFPLFLTLLTLLCWTSPAGATERLAVLELSGDLQPKERAILTDTVRGAVVDALGGRIQVMTKENMEAMLTEIGKRIHGATVVELHATLPGTAHACPDPALQGLSRPRHRAARGA